jgi:hypothetical protein
MGTRKKVRVPGEKLPPLKFPQNPQIFIKDASLSTSKRENPGFRTASSNIVNITAWYACTRSCTTTSSSVRHAEVVELAEERRLQLMAWGDEGLFNRELVMV